MNREIKFRMWSAKVNKYFYDSINVFECLIQQNTGLYDHIADGMVFEQFTGLKDKNGKEIYENDVLGLGEDKEDDSICSVVFEDGSFRRKYKDWDDRNTKPCLCKFDIELLHWEIIGNIHEQLNKE